MSAEAASLSIERLDARPVRTVSNETVWDEATAVRDRFAAVVEDTLASEGIRALVLKSQVGNYPVWIRLEAWLPLAETGNAPRQRCEFELIVDAKPFNKHRLTYTARLARGRMSISLVERTRFFERDVAEWTRYTVDCGPKPSNYTPRLDAVRQMLGVLVPPLLPRYNPLGREFSNTFLDPRVVAAAVCGMVLIGVAYPPVLYPVAMGVSVVCLIATLVLIFTFWRVEQRDWVVPQPAESPRNLGYLDGWHTMLAGVGRDRDNLKERLVERLAERKVPGFSTRIETYGYPTSNGYEERERFVLSRAQTYVHVHIHTVGEDLFVGWQVQINWAQWVETTPVATRDHGTYIVAFHDLRPGWYLPGPFDLIDADTLSAIVHRALEREIKALLKERAVDQEVDFEIMRVDRAGALDHSQVWPERSGKRARDSNTILGWGAVRRASQGEMKLISTDAQAPAVRRGLAVIPGVILLPALTLFLSTLLLPLLTLGGSSLFDLTSIRTEAEFSFSPLPALPLFVALAIGLWLYAGVRFAHLLLFIGLAEALLFSLSYFLDSLGFVFTRIVIGSPYSAAAHSISILFAVSVWAPELRKRKYWVIGLMLWTIVGMVRFFDEAIIAACVGYWLRQPGAGRMGSPLRALVGAWRTLAPERGDRSMTAPAIRGSAGPDINAGWLLIPLGAVAFYLSRDLPMGSAVRLGPGYMPTVLSVMLLLLGAGAAIQDFQRRRRVSAISYASLCVVLGGAAAFALTLDALGLIVATALAAGVTGCYTARDRRGAIVWIVVVSVLIVVGIAQWLGLPMPLWKL